MIGHYQAGRDPTPELALRPGPLPKFDSGSTPGLSPTIQPPPGPPPSQLQPQSSGSGPIRVPPLSPEKASQYAGLFEKSGAQNGVLPGNQAKQIFERAGLPNEILGKIWNLADTEQKGSLQVTEFIIAMHLLASFKGGQLRALPNVLPAGLYEAASRRPPGRQSPIPAPVSAIPRQFSGTGAGRAGSPLSRTAYGPPPPQQFSHATGQSDWAITPGDKAKFDSIYSNLDRANKGYITGDEAVPFFSESKLPEEALAQIWDLADINSAGHLTRDEFAVAMYLIRQQRGKRDGRDTLPGSLPANLIPPSMRNQYRPANVPTAPAFEAPAPALPRSAAEDLFGLDALSSPAPEQAPQSTGGSNSFGPGPSRQVDNDPFGISSLPFPTSPTSPNRHSPQSNVFKPFAPSSSFGQTLSYQATGGSNGSAPSQQRSFQPQTSSATEDLLGDNDPEISSKLNNETSELANLSNQVGNLSKQMQDVQGQRATSQNELTQASSQKKEFEARLAQLRALYEKEVKDVRSLEEKLTASRNETKKLQTEIAMLEGTHQDLQTQHQQILTALQADQQENANLKERMRIVNGEITQLKPALEKLRSDARQQKGLVAIHKKQLATNEAERERMKAEAEEHSRSIEEDTKTLAAAAKIQSSPQVASPALSTMSANNPFFRRQASTSDAPTSPFASSPAAGTPQNDRTFENVFGPAFGAAAATSAAPPTSFKNDSTRSPSVSSNPAQPTRSHTGSGSGFPTPSSSPPTTANRELSLGQELPAPPDSRQFTPSFLPFPSHQDSVTSSRVVSAPNSRSGESGTDTPTNYMGTTPTGSSTAGPMETTRAISPGIDRKSNASPGLSDHKDSIPGAFPGDAHSGIVATPTGGSTLSDQAADPFSINKVPERTVTTKGDFDAAFAGLNRPAKMQERSNTGSSIGSGSAAGPSIAGFNKEFPPIAEMDQDEDTESEGEVGGFDDDFAPSSPGHTRNKSSASQATTGASSMLGVRPTATQQSSALSLGGTAPPTPGAQASPPQYDNVVSPSEHTHQDIQQYSGLIPSREIPVASPAASPELAKTTNSGGPVPFSAPKPATQPAPPAKVPFEDDFDDFADLEDAKEGDADDDFTNISGHEHSGSTHDFNPVFDSPPSAAKSVQHPTHSNGFNGTDAFGDFTSPPVQPTAPSTATSQVNDNHDWDAIFAGLDATPPSVPDAPPAAPEPPKALGNGTSKAAAERPQIGRALTEAGVHDDPILKNLTSMGYNRNDALAALEKYDYNLERVGSLI